MRKKTIMAAITLTVLFLSVAGMQADLAKANFYDPGPLPATPVAITLFSPVNGTTYSGYVDFRFTIQTQPWGADDAPNLYVSCWLDGKFLKDYNHPEQEYSALLTNLSKGMHYIEAKASGAYFFWKTYPVSASTGKVYFTVNSSTQTFTGLPEVRLLSHQIQEENAAFNFTVNKPSSWIAYRLDQNDLIPITEKVAVSRWIGLYNYYYKITGLTEGEHTVIFYANDESGNIGETSIFSFTINAPTPTLSPSPSPSPSPSASPNPSPSIPEFPTWTALLLVLAASIVFLVSRKRRPR